MLIYHNKRENLSLVKIFPVKPKSEVKTSILYNLTPELQKDQYANLKEIGMNLRANSKDL